MTLQSLAKQLSDYSEKLDEGTLTPEEILKLTDIARDFHERMIVLRYKTVEESMHREAENDPAPESKIEEIAEPVAEVIPVEETVEKEVEIETSTIETPEEEAAEQNIPEEETSEIESTQTPEPAEPAELEVAEEATQYNTAPAVSPNQISLIDSIEEIKQMEKSLNDALKNDGTTLAQKLHQKPIRNLRSAFTINQKFQFISHLFDNDAEAFESSVARLDGCATFLEADEYIQNNLKDHFDWEMKSPAVKEMMDMVERRFL